MLNELQSGGGIDLSGKAADISGRGNGKYTASAALDMHTAQGFSLSPRDFFNAVSIENQNEVCSVYQAIIHTNKGKLRQTFSEGATLLSVLSEAGVYIDAPCGGNGHCGKCKVTVTGGTDKPEPSEERFLSPSERAGGVRLACFCRPVGHVELWIMSSGYEVQTAFGMLCTEPMPSVDLVPALLRHDVAAGMAVDIGTTTVAAFFYDLSNGKPLLTVSGVNAQKPYGADVMSRIHYCTKNKDGLKRLQSLILSQLNGMAEQFERATGIPRTAICDCVIAGNTTMELIAAGCGIESLGYAPYTPESLLGECVPARDLGLSIAGDAQVFFMPCPGGFLGGDAVSVMLSCGFDQPGKTAYMVDIGTNGEMAAVRDGRIFACSTAAGPALEGAQIKFGTGSIPGAIRSVKIGADGRLAVSTVGDAPAVGICGSGIVDGVAAMLRLGALDETGRIEEDSPYIALDRDERVFPVLGDIHLTQKDIREVQLAKSAICSGTRVLVEQCGMDSGNLSEIFVAGGFGSHLDLENAGRIGLLPEWMAARAAAVGNAAGKGAVLALLNSEQRRRAMSIAKSVHLIELTGSPRFEQEFVDNMMFE